MALAQTTKRFIYSQPLTFVRFRVLVLWCWHCQHFSVWHCSINYCFHSSVLKLKALLLQRVSTSFAHFHMPTHKFKQWLLVAIKRVTMFLVNKKLGRQNDCFSMDYNINGRRWILFFFLLCYLGDWSWRSCTFLVLNKLTNKYIGISFHLI